MRHVYFMDDPVVREHQLHHLEGRGDETEGGFENTARYKAFVRRKICLERRSVCEGLVQMGKRNGES